MTVRMWLVAVLLTPIAGLIYLALEAWGIYRRNFR